MSYDTKPLQMKEVCICGCCQPAGCHHDVKVVSGIQFLEFTVFNVESKILSLFVHGFKTAGSRKNLIVANLALREQPCVAIFCKTLPNPLDTKVG